MGHFRTDSLVCQGNLYTYQASLGMVCWRVLLHRKLPHMADQGKGKGSEEDKA